MTDKHVDGWDDPRLMTLAGLRRRGVTPTAINDFIKGIGITRRFIYVASWFISLLILTYPSYFVLISHQLYILQ